FFFSSRRRHTRFSRDWSSDVCSSDLTIMKLMRENNVDPSCIMVMPIQTYKQYAQLYETLKRHILYRDANNIEGLRMIECQLRGVEMLEKLGWQPSSSDPKVILQEMSDTILKLSHDKSKMAELIQIT